MRTAFVPDTGITANFIPGSALLRGTKVISKLAQLAVLVEALDVALDGLGEGVTFPGVDTLFFDHRSWL
jgi:hypothetical protein